MVGRQGLRSLVALVSVACGTSDGTGRSRIFDEAGTSSGGSGSTEGGITDGSTLDGSFLAANQCDTGPVTHVVGSRSPESPVEAGAPAGLRVVDAGFVLVTPTDPCVTYRRPECSGGPRWIFGCPSVVGPNGSTAIHPGDSITVNVPVTDEGLDAYSCSGLDTDGPLAGGSELFSAVKPAYVQESGQVPASTKPGTVYHFTAVASGSRYNAGTACENDVTRLDFDVTVE